MKLSTDSDPDYEYFKNLNHNISNLQILNKSKKIIEIIFKFLESRHELVGTLIDSLFGSNENIVKDLEFSDLKKKSETDPSDAQDPVSAEPVPVISDLESVSSASEILTTTEKVFLNILIAISNSHLARFEVANLFYQRANQLDNNNADVYYQLAQYQIRLDQSELALSNFKMAYTKSGENFGKAYAYICYLEFLKSLKMPSSSPNSNLNSKKSSEKDLQDAIQDGDPVSPREQAIAKFAEGEKRFPNTTELFCLHAQALESLQKFEAAIEMYDLCSQKDSEDDQAILYKARLLHNLGKSQACIQICENIILKSGILNENYMSQMEAEIQQQKTKSLAEASAASPKQQKIIQEGLDDKLEKLKQYKQQSQAGKKFVKSNSLDFTYEILATVYTDLDKNSQAIICYEHAITYCNNKMDIYKYFVQMFMLKVKSEVYNQFDLSG